MQDTLSLPPLQPASVRPRPVEAGWLLAEASRLIEPVLDELLPQPDAGAPALATSMRYATLDGGKRLRPFLVLASARLFGVAEARALRVGAALEMIHCYSLVHDDLPAMDNDDLRRGRPTTHKAFDEATAILAGDGLLTLAFEVLSDPRTHVEPHVRIALVASLAKAAGAAGMVGGQALDMAAEATTLTEIDSLARLQRLKTGALFAFGCEAGAILGQADDAHRNALLSYADDLGAAFQIADDLLDVRGEAAEIGKTPGKDVATGKATFVSFLGLDQAEIRARQLADRACGHLDIFGGRADPLRTMARFVVDRRS